MACRVMTEKKHSINRPWGAGSSAGACSGVSGEPVKVLLDAGDDARVPGDFGMPAAFGGVVAERGGVGELGLEGGDELLGGGEVVALLADVGVLACLGGKLPGAVSVRNPGFEHLAVQPSDPVGDDGLAGRGDGHGQPGAGLAHCLVVGGPDRRSGQRGIPQGHLGGDMLPEQSHQCLQRHASVNW